MTRRTWCGVLAGAAVALLVSLAAGCSSPCGGRSCGPTTGGRPPAPPPVAAPPAAGGGAATLPATAAPYGGQKTCPVMGEELGAMGEPIPVTVRGQTVYVCCRGCAARAQREPEKTLAAVAADRERRQP